MVTSWYTKKREYTFSLSIFLLLRHFRNATRHKDNIKYKTCSKNFLALEQHPFNNFAYISCTLSHSWHYSKQAHVHKTMYAIDLNRVKAKKTRHVFVKHRCPWRQQNRNMAKISKSYILTPPHPQGHVMSVKCEEPIDELTVQVWLLYHHPNFEYCTLFVSGTELRTDKRTDRRTIRLLDALADLSGRGHN